MANILSYLSTIISKRKKRVGRGLGSGKGAKSGRGTTRHQKARESIPLSFEGGQGRIVKRFPLLRGKGKNKSIKKKKIIINLSDLNRFSDGEKVDVEALIKKKIISKEIQKNQIKILSKGEIKRKLIVLLPVSKPAQKKIEQFGGKVEK